MRKRWATAVRVAVWSVVGIVGISSLALAKLVYPGTPRSGSSMTFEGYIELPKGGDSLSKLDYITPFEDGLFVTDESDGSVYKVSLHGGASPRSATVETFAGEGSAHGVVIDPVTQLAFVTKSEANMVDVFDPHSLKLIKHIPVADDSDGIFYDPGDKLIYVANGDPKLATLIDPAKQETIATIPLSGTPEYAAYDPQTRFFYHNLKDTNAIAIVDPARHLVVKDWSVPQCEGPTPMAIDAGSRRLFVACAVNSILLALDLDTYRVVASVAAAGKPDSIAFDPDLHRLYVTGRGGELSIIKQNSADDYQLLETIPMHYGAHTLALDPVTHRVYVGYASLFVRPRLAVFRPNLP